MRHSIQSGFSVRAVVLGLILIIPNVFWTVYGEVISQTDLNSTSLMMPPLCTLLLLLICNAGIRRIWPKKALLPAELISIYVIVTMATVLAGMGMLQFIITTLPAGYHYGLVSKDIATVTKSFPAWAMPNSTVTEAFYKGNSSVPWSAWALPLTIWGGFLMIMVWTMYCMNAMFRKQWMDRERLTYPIVLLPLEMTDPNAGFFKNKLMWAGFAVPVILESMNSLNALFPSVPFLQIRARELAVFFPDPPWNSMGPLQTTFYPLAIGLGYLLPADVSFSCSFFYILTRLENVATAAIGLNQGGGTGAQWPFLGAQGVGGFLGLAAMTIWLARKHLADVWRGAWKPKQADDADEPMSYRAACVGLLLGIIGLMAYGYMFKISPAVFGLYLLLYLAFSLTITRLRAEAGPAWTMGPAMNAVSVTHTTIGTINMTDTDIHKLALFGWFAQEMRCCPMPVSAEAMKMQHGQRTPRTLLTGVLMLASVIGIVVGFIALLMVYYQSGAASSKVDPWRTGSGLAPYWTAFSAAMNPRNPDWSQLGGTAFGALVAVGLTFARTLFVWWPLHPAGYVLANTGTMDWLWLPFAIAWAFKISFLKIGGVKSYRNAMPFFMGLVVGDYVTSALWALLGSLLRMPMYRCFPC
ncbi:MAG: DUF6785 family protein [Armatimonadota bacterium]